MSFGAQGYLLLLVLVPLVGGLAAWWLLWRRAARQRLGQRAAGSAAPLIGPALLIGAIAFAGFAAARPQIGERTVQVEDRGIDVVIVLDVSQSMFAADAEPTRLGRAQSEIIALLDRMQGDRAGLVIFAGQPFTRSPLTSDLPALARLVAGVHEERGLLQPGSDLGAAITAGQRLLQGGDADSKAMLLISDGEDHGRGIDLALAEASAAGITLYAAGAGTPGGAPVLDTDPDTLATRPRLDASGAPVTTRLDAAALTRIAEAGGGRYVQLAGDGRPLTGLGADFDSLGATTFGREETATPTERFRTFAAIALALAVAGSLLPLLAAREARARVLRLWPLAGAGLLIGAICTGGAADANRRGNRSYVAGEYGAALDAYRTAQALAPDRDEPYYNASNALDRDGDYAAAIDEAKRVFPAANEEIEALTEYALGNHYAGASRTLDALEAYKRALLADPDDADAKHNLEVLLERLAEQPTATPSPPPVEGTPTPGDGQDGDPGGQPTASGGEATAEATAGNPGGEGTPQVGDSESDLSPQEIQRRLDEALEGIDEEFTVEEALRVLDLLNRQNRGELAAPADDGDSATPDY